jgi:glycosyltransferase involved in cell wall biosynthesis
MPTVSVILPTYNRAHLLPRAIATVLAQTYQDFELIVVDDGSTDHTKSILQSFTDPRLHCLRHGQNRGAAAARNTGIRASRGAYIAFQDSDDQWWPTKLARQLEAFEQVGLDTAVVFSQFQYVKNNASQLVPPADLELGNDIYNRLLRGNFITTQAALVRRTSLSQSGLFDESLPCLVDWELWLRLAPLFRFHYLPEPLLTVYATPASISRNPARLAFALVSILQQHFMPLQQDRKILASHLYAIGHLLFISAHQTEGRAYLVEAIKQSPGNARYWLTALLSLLGLPAYTSIYRLKSSIWPDWY